MHAVCLGAPIAEPAACALTSLLWADPLRNTGVAKPLSDQVDVGQLSQVRSAGRLLTKNASLYHGPKWEIFANRGG